MAIILKKGRGFLDIVQDSYTRPEPPWEVLGESKMREQIEPAIRAVGRLDTPRGPQSPYAGTAFVVGKDLIMTATFVAKEALKSEVFLNLGAEVVPRETTRIAISPTPLLEHPHIRVTFMRGSVPDDVVPLRIAATAPPIVPGCDVVVIGYPSKDLRGEPHVIEPLLRGTYEAKRLMPGKLVKLTTYQHDDKPDVLVHDASTLGGCSGAPVVDIETGLVVGLHFAGMYLDANYAYPLWELARDPRVRALGVVFAGDLPNADDPWRALYEHDAAIDGAGEAAEAPSKQTIPDLFPNVTSPTTETLPQDRPSFDVVAGKPQITPFWASALDPHRARLELTLRAVGRVAAVGAEGIYVSLGNCVLIGEKLALTTGTIAKQFAERSGERYALRAGANPVIDFQQGLGVARPFLLAVCGVEFIHPYFDIALVRLSASPQSLAMLSLAATTPYNLSGRLVATITHTESRFSVQPGAALQLSTSDDGVLALEHDCLPQADSPGAPLIDLGSGHVLGVCAGGSTRSFAQPSWELARDPRVWDHALAFRPDPRPPWRDRWNQQEVQLSQTSRRARGELPRDHWTRNLDFERDEPRAVERLLRDTIQQPALVTFLAENAGIPNGSVNESAPIQVVWRETLKVAYARGRLVLLLERIASNPDYAGISDQLRGYLQA